MFRKCWARWLRLCRHRPLECPSHVCGHVVGERESQQRRDRVSYLTERRIHCPSKHKAVRETLQPCGLTHADGPCLLAVIVDVRVGILAKMGQESAARPIRYQLPPPVREAVERIRRNHPGL